MSVWRECANYRSSRPSAAACIRCGLSAGAGMVALSRRCSAARSAMRHGLGLRPGGWRYDLVHHRAKPRLLAPTDTGCTPPDRTAAGEMICSLAVYWLLWKKTFILHLRQSKVWKPSTQNKKLNFRNALFMLVTLLCYFCSLFAYCLVSILLTHILSYTSPIIQTGFYYS